ncbi:hypothetical protein BDS110ZK4_13830 [Bradyrhizobium diazoefficiens]|uniref:Uncharacterized protein n=2 Tax=Bradyrhizobium diazoefficiens TaxID=1355477 RepID=A0A809ZD69_9BRAD|nr:hypothetical protein XF4B_67580 [Bradyrhizobium diazoefficiens]BCE74024.1 hypothetical protein XF8B_41350 [Bradyrhizobium diazoefficiens]BCE93914.1 hypothetical protein XF10B_67120 [Bradyrhizobium diazoefficiens]BCF28854.1 hypothetical protein XF14B_68060 [Bradyrhizobium diazoefficiens]BCF36414.1 hypothetical protein XF15B_54850 [Bradyrhizobium diazoefficiens]
MVQLALFIIEAQQERAYDFAPGSTPLSVAKTPNHAVRGADAFDLSHAFAIAGLVGKIDAFGDDTIATTTGPSEPPFGIGMISTCRREDKDLAALEMPFGEPFQRRAPFREREPRNVVGPAAKKIKREKYGRRFRGKPFDAACRWVDALQQIIERKALADWND